MKNCYKCGKEVEDNDKFCPNCGAALNETVEAEVVSENYSGDEFEKEKVRLRDEYSRRAGNAFTLSIASVLLCCCSITAVISLIFSITLILDMNKMSEEIKKTEEYHKIRNKNIIAMVLAGFVVVMWLVSFIEGLVNPIDYDALYDSIYGELMNSGLNG